MSNAIYVQQDNIDFGICVNLELANLKIIFSVMEMINFRYNQLSSMSTRFGRIMKLINS